MSETIVYRVNDDGSLVPLRRDNYGWIDDEPDAVRLAKAVAEAALVPSSRGTGIRYVLWKETDILQGRTA